jgi:hypothetical protein
MTVDATNLTLDETIGNRFGLDPDPGSRTYDVAMAGAVHPNVRPRPVRVHGPVDDDDARRRHPVAPARLRPGRDADGDLAHDDARSRRPDTRHRRHAVGRARRHDHVSVAPNEYMLFDASFVARKLDDAQTTPTPTIDGTTKVRSTTSSRTSTIDGGSEAAVSLESFSLTLSNNIDRDFVVLGSAEVYSLAQGNADISGSFTIREALNTHYRNSLVTDGTKKYKIRILATGRSSKGRSLRRRVHRRACDADAGVGAAVGVGRAEGDLDRLHRRLLVTARRRR